MVKSEFDSLKFFRFDDFAQINRFALVVRNFDADERLARNAVDAD